MKWGKNTFQVKYIVERDIIKTNVFQWTRKYEEEKRKQLTNSRKERVWEQI